jgi:hypothetical protein
MGGVPAPEKVRPLAEVRGMAGAAPDRRGRAWVGMGRRGARKRADHGWGEWRFVRWWDGRRWKRRASTESFLNNVIYVDDQ